MGLSRILLTPPLLLSVLILTIVPEIGSGETADINRAGQILHNLSMKSEAVPRKRDGSSPRYGRVCKT
jgi:hypothetical protein